MSSRKEFWKTNTRDFFNILIGGMLAWGVWDLSEKFFPREPETLEELVQRTQEKLPPNCQAFGIGDVDELRDIIAVNCEGQGVVSVNGLLNSQKDQKYVLVFQHDEEI